MSNNLIIAISGKSGCGNSSVSRIVAERLGLKLINYTFHDIAEGRGFKKIKRRNIPYIKALRETENRDSRDRNRYLRLYGIDIDNYKFVDLIVNTEEGNQFYVSDSILKALSLHTK